MTISLAEAKAHCIVEHSLDDGYLIGLIQAATAATEDYTRTVVTQRAISKTFDAFDNFRLKGPFRSVTSLTYIDDNGVSQVVSPSVYQNCGVWTSTNDAKTPYITLAYNQDWPSARVQAEAVTVNYVAGYSQNEIPEALRHAILLMVGNLYSNREPIVIGASVQALGMSYEWLLAPFRVLNL